MDIVIRRCAGLDVHKKTVVVGLRCLDASGELRGEVRTYETVTRGLLALADWLRSEAVTHVAMESTGVYWKPVFNILEAHFEILLVNAHHVKQVPGRKTDVKDCEWIAKLLQHGLLRGSFVPPRPIRDLRDLTRSRAKLMDEHTRVANRIQKILEDANVKLASVATDVLGASGRGMLAAITEGVDDPEKLADLAKRRLRAKIPELRSALHGRITEHHRFLLRMELKHLAGIEELVAEFDHRIEEATRPFSNQIALLQTSVGVKQRTAENVLAEIGPNMAQFPSEKHLANWAGICPGNRESAGKRQSGKIAKGNVWCRRALTQAAWAASHTKKTYYAALYRRLAGRRGKKRAIVAVAHSMLIAIFHMLSRNVPFADLGPEHLDSLNAERKVRYHLRRLKELGKEVTMLEDRTAA